LHHNKIHILEKKIGIYICDGCGIESAVNTRQLLDSINDVPSVAVKKCHPALCSREGVEIIRSDVAAGELDGIIIGACSPRVRTTIFKFENTQTERVNLREQVAWCSIPNNEDTQVMAEDYLRIAVAKLLHTQLPHPFISENISADILIVGGGISGITSAIGGSRAGYNVVLVEKEPVLGGWMNRLYKQMPVSEPYSELIEPLINLKIEELQSCSNIKILTSSTITEIKGQPGNFEVSVKNGKDEHFHVGAIIASMGWRPYDANKLLNLGYGKFRNVVTSIELEDMARMNKIALPSNGKMPDNVLFIQCAGSRDKEHLPYCSSICCGTTLKQVKYIREKNQYTRIYVIYKDIRTPGLLEEFYKEEQKDELLFLTKGEITSIEQAGDKLRVVSDNTLLGEKILLEIDMIVLATGMTPADTTELNLQYRQGKGLPSLKYQFPDSHFICFPYETRRTGIYAAGTVRAPMDSTACEEDAAGAVLKAIQCIESVKRGEAVLPRTGDRSFPELYMDRCTDCKRCTEECPFGSYDETPKGTPLPNPNRCRRCGICIGSCPERVISFDDFSINSISQMIKSISIPDEFENKLRILAFVCENDAYPAFDFAGINRLKYSPFIRIIPVRCIGSVNKVWISDALSRGFDGILQFGCKPGDDYQCHFINGSELTVTRSENIKETLKTMMLEPERIKTIFLEITDYHKIPEIINDYVEQIELIGPNPFKSM
jgi:quinone-modifying oxidoreductase subunit QmoB